MTLELQINEKIKDAMRAKAETELSALRAIKSAILMAKTEEGATDPLTPEAEQKILLKQAKQRRESADIYTAQNRADLASVELAELAVIQQFLPQQMNAEALKVAIQTIITDTGATSAKDMGRIMGIASKTLAGQADGKDISAMVKALLPAA